MLKLSRREFLMTSSSLAAIASGITLAGATTAKATETITVVEWGGDYLAAMKELASKQSDIGINWHVHSGGSMVIFPKIKATWPNTGIDLLTGWDASWQVIVREGWAEPVTAERVPNLADVPQSLLVKDGAGNVVNIPRTVTSLLWYCLEDAVPFEIKTIDDLLDPRLQGKICFPSPSINNNLQMVSLALHKGGDEKNMEPAWDFMKKLAKSGNIGRVANSPADISISITSGETCISFDSSSDILNIARDTRTFKIRYLTKMAKETGFRTFLLQEGWCVLKGGRADAAFKFANFAINPENNATFNREIGGIPVNSKSPVADDVKPLMFSNDEIEEYAYIPDWPYFSTQADAWMKRWEQEVMPLL